MILQASGHSELVSLMFAQILRIFRSTICAAASTSLSASADHAIHNQKGAVHSADVLCDLQCRGSQTVCTEEVQQQQHYSNQHHCPYHTASIAALISGQSTCFHQKHVFRACAPHCCICPKKHVCSVLTLLHVHAYAPHCCFSHDVVPGRQKLHMVEGGSI